MNTLKKPLHKIGTVSSMSGVPSPTLRIWQSRYEAFKPFKTPSSHRLYSDEDVLKATLLKKLTDQGHAISQIAPLGLEALNDLAQSHEGQRSAVTHRLESASIAVVGLGLATRLEGDAFSTLRIESPIWVKHIFEDVPQALQHPFAQGVQILMIKLNSLHTLAQADVFRLARACSAYQVIVLYNFGQAMAIDWLKKAGMRVRREPVSDAELVELIHSCFFVDEARAGQYGAQTAVIAPRKYSDQTLARVAQISTQVLCECPHHVAELIAQLASFEQYSQECLNQSEQDAHLHAYLHSVAGTARALFENALERVAQHEGIDLSALACNS